MSMQALVRKAKNAYISTFGFHTDEHLLVIESDDWGSIRTPSRETFLKLQAEGDHPEKDAFLRSDCLESQEDLDSLFALLRSVRDGRDHPAVVTANFAMANPDFDRIDYEKGIYHNESFLETYKRYGHRENNLQMIKDAYKEGSFVPQLHCREHLNVRRWMRDLAEKKKDTLWAFREKMVGIGASFTGANQFAYMDAFNYDTPAACEDLANILKEAQAQFESVFGFKSETFVASCFVWGTPLEKVMQEISIRGIQCGEWQLAPTSGEGTLGIKRRLHYTGQRSSGGQLISVRNCSYEPAYYHNPKTCAKDCFRQVAYAFAHRKPAIVNSHRFNYIDTIQPGNAEKNRQGLKTFLDMVLQAYPDVQFISSVDMHKKMRETIR